ncbi:type VI secretion system membrane subunit TssM [Marinobacter sp. chi1]|uniref:Type VI secretion system membrane subunit TssM n=1 Tax=Marinobacter suaedae TaxID=3057675 RepID=A0ABT8VW16_9GAMM|nr:type VI secretion system membrane subunit TssM [Marinobacter sp. chi1]MDO3720174.1 type VI secretion system membrane subunit TssM [Marinobacter sp. chi1]
MKKVIVFFKKRYVIEVIGLFLLSIAIWFGFSYISFGADKTTLPPTAKLLIIVVVWLLWLLKVLFTMLKESHRSNGFTRELQRSSGTAKDSDQPQNSESRDEVKQLKSRFNEAIGRLAKSRFGASRKKLYELPWYIMVGPPGAGKTTAILNSGLTFPLKDPAGGSIAGTGGTRHCDWWFTDEAVLIDTAGRFTTQDSNRRIDSTAWFGFLDLLKKYRKRRPINGVIVSVSAQDLLLKSGSQQAELAETIRCRLDELNNRLSIQVPIYLVITKLDLLKGFIPFFSDMTLKDREQPWGAHLDQQSDVETLKKRLGDLTNRLSRRSFSRLLTENDLQKRSAIQNFPMQFEELAAATCEFFSAAFTSDRYRSTPQIRGVYFTSATQEGSPIDRMMAVVHKHFNLGRAASTNQSATGKSFFVHDLFRRVIFPEANLGGVNKSHERSLIWSRRIAIGSAALITSIVAAGWSSSILNNKTLMSDVKSEVEQFQQLSFSAKGTSPDLDKLASILQRTERASLVYDAEESPWLTNWGIFNKRVDESADRLHRTTLEHFLAPEIIRRLEGSLEHKLTHEEPLGMFSELKIYLMLERPDKRVSPQMISHLAKLWRQQFPDLTDSRTHLETYTGQLLGSNQLAMNTNEKLVSSARAAIMKQPPHEMVYELFLQDLNQNPDLLLSENVSKSTLNAFGLTADDERSKIPYRFTRKAWSDADFSEKSDLLKHYRNNLWVLGPESSGEALESEVAEIAKKVRANYLADYESFWEERIKQWNLTPQSTLSKLDMEFKLYANPDKSPILEMSGLIASQTKLTKKLPTEAIESEKLKGAVDLLATKINAPTNVDLAFKDIHEWLGTPDESDTKSSKTIDRLKAASEYISTITVSSSADEAAFNAVKRRFLQPQQDALQGIRIQAHDSPPPIKKWLETAASRLWQSLINNAYQFANSRLHENVCDFFEEKLANKFPMANVTSEVRTDDFNTFFAPGGIEASYAESYVSPFIDIWNEKAKIIDGRRFPISSTTVSMAQRASFIRESLYHYGENAGLRLELYPLKLDRSVSSFGYFIDGQPEVQYRHGPKLPTDVEWTSGSGQNVRLEFIDINRKRRDREYTGPWAGLRSLYDNSPRALKAENEMQVSFNVDGREAKYRVRADYNIDAIRYNSLYKYECPKSL